MKKILKIAKLELNTLFYSPVAWLVFAIFMVQSAISFLDNLESFQRGLAMGYDLGSVTSGLFASRTGLFTVVPANLYLYLPILTMGLMSREISSGSIKLLLSSPVKLRQIILGKYLAIISYGFMLIIILTIYALIAVVVVNHVDAGMIISGLFGLFLLICAYGAIGLFMSCLTSYQVVAAICTLTIFAILRYIGSIGQNIDFVRDLTYFLSISGRTDKMTNGMVTSRDVFYYLIIISTFLILCVLRLKGQRELKPWGVKAGRYVMLICLALGLGYLTSRPILIGYLDLTANKSLTIIKPSQELAKKFPGELKVTTYTNLFAPNTYATLPESRNRDLARLEPYQRFIPSMDFKYVYFYHQLSNNSFADYRSMPGISPETTDDEIAEKLAGNMNLDKDMFMKPATVDGIADLSSEGFLTVRKLEYNGKSTILRFYFSDSDTYPGEAEMMAALKRLLVKSPKVAFLTGNNERSIVRKGDREYQVISALKTGKQSLINQGFDVDTLNINLQDIPSDIDIVVLGDPTMPFNTSAQQRIATFIQKGGDMLITGEPGRQQILNPVLKQLGVQLKHGVLVKPDANLTPGFVNAQFSGNAAGLDSNFARLYDMHGTVAVQGAAAIDYTASGEFAVKPVLLSSEGGWNSAAETDLTMVAMDIDTLHGDEAGVFPITVALTRNVKGKEQRIMVSGDADFIANSEFSRLKRGYNQYFLDGVFRWFSNGVFPIDVARPGPKDTDISVSKPAITILMYLCKGVIPGLIALVGTIVLFRRRRN